MTRVSKRIISKELHEELRKQLQVLIASLVHAEDIELFLSEFLTKEEKTMLGKRLLLYMLLYKGFSSSDIHEILLMSYETIRGYKNAFEAKPEVFKRQIAVLIKKEKTAILWSTVEKILTPISLALEAKTNMKARARLLSGDF